MQIGVCRPYSASITQRQCDINRQDPLKTACPRCAGLTDLRDIANVQTAQLPKRPEPFVGEELLVVFFSGEDKEILEQLLEHSTDLAYDIATIVNEFIDRHV